MLERLFIFLMVIFTIGLSTGVSSARQVELKSNYNTSVQNQLEQGRNKLVSA